MKAISLEWDSPEHIEEKTKGLMPAEHLFVSLSPEELNAESISFLKKLNAQTSELFICFKLLELMDERVINQVLKAGLKKITVSFRVSEQTLPLYKSLRDKLAKKAEVYPEFICDEMNSAHLTGYFAKCEQWKVPWVGLVPVQFTRVVSNGIKDSIAEFALKKPKLKVYFLHSFKHTEMWDSVTENVLSGPSEVDIDVANTCTHNCVFCGSYSTEYLDELKLSNKGKIPENIRKYLSRKIDANICKKLIAGLPLTVKSVQFGGVGDPYTHPSIDDFIVAARSRGFWVSVLSNYSYMNSMRIERLHKQSGGQNTHFTVNLSAATPETYARIRPNQSANTFNQVVQSLMHTRELAKKDGVEGITITLMSVTNKLNYLDAPALVDLSNTVGAQDLWIKPLEIYSKLHIPLLPAAEEIKIYAQTIGETIDKADKMKVKLKEREVLEAIVSRFS